MPYREPDPSDPSMLVGTAVACDREQLVEMAASFAAELAQMGHATERIMGFFRKPSYAGPHLAWRTLGEGAIQRLVSEATELWGRCRVVVKDAQEAPARLVSIGGSDPRRRGRR